MGNNERSSIVMTESELDSFITRSRLATLATIGPSGMPHLVAMWFGYLRGSIYFETKAKSQKAVNLRRNPQVACMIEAGDTYNQLRGVSIEGTASFIDDTEDPEYWEAAISVWERYNGPYSEQARPLVEYTMNKRVVVRIDQARVRSWDHRKLDLPEMPLAGTTAEYLRNP